MGSSEVVKMDNLVLVGSSVGWVGKDKPVMGFLLERNSVSTRYDCR